MTAKDLFSRDAKVEYRVVPTLDGNAQWHWVLFNVMGKVLAGNTARSRGIASAQARAKARQLHRKIRSVSVSGLVEEGKPIDIKKFIAKYSKWIDVADRFGYKPTQDQFWAKAANGEPIYARTIEGLDYNYTISTFGGTGDAKGGGQLVWVAVDALDVNNRARFALQTFVTTDKKLPHVLSVIEETVNTYGISWGEVDRILNDLRNQAEWKGVFEAEEKVPSHPVSENPAKDFIMANPTWEERLKMMHAFGPKVHMTSDSEMEHSCLYNFHWGFKSEWASLDLFVHFSQPHVPKRVALRGEWFRSEARGNLNNDRTLWHNAESLDVDGYVGMNAFLDQLQPVVDRINSIHAEAAGDNPPSHWEFVQLVSRLQSWMVQQPEMSAYI